MVRILILIPLLFISIMFIFVKFISFLSNNSELMQLEPVISSINTYHQIHHKIPESINDIADYSVGYLSRNPVYYNKCNENRYLITIMVNSSRNMTYDSKDKRWHRGNITCQH